VDIPVEGRRAKVLIVARTFFAGLAIAAAVLGAWGMWRYVPPPADADPLHRYIDLAYYVLQLFVLDSTPLVGGPYPWQLEVARFAAPVATAYALGEAAWAVFGDRLSRHRLRRRGGHTIVVGTTPTAQAIVHGVATTGPDQVVVAPNGDPETLRAHGIAGATALFACEDDARDRGVNVATVLAGVSLRSDGGLKAYAQVADADLALALRARRLSTDDPTRLDFFNVDEVAARLVIESTDLDAVARPRLLIAGLSTFGRAILVEFARHWRLRSTWRAERPVVAVVDEGATAAVADLASQWPFVATVCELHPVDGRVEHALKIGRSSAPTTAYICYDSEELALRTALTAATLWLGGPRSLVVRLDLLSRLGTAFSQHGSGRDQRRLLDDLGGRLLLVGVTEIAADALTIIRQDLVERLAQVIHEQYLLSQLNAGLRLGSKPTLRLWAELSEDARDSNRAQALHVGTKLQRVGCTVAPYVDDDAAVAFTEEEMLQLSMLEHERWMAERIRAGWQYGPVRDDDRRITPALRPWAELSAEEKEKDANAVRTLATVLADVGLRIVRLTPPVDADAKDDSPPSPGQR
jgi:hypothetical protein